MEERRTGGAVASCVWFTGLGASVGFFKNFFLVSSLLCFCELVVQ